MKKLLILTLALALAACNNTQQTGTQQASASKADSPKTTAQATSAAPADKPIQPLPIPNFSILTADSTMFTPANLKKDKPVMLVYFSPDCSHCQRMLYELKPRLDELKSVQIIMVTWSNKYDIRGIKEFRRDYDLKKYPNITLGTEGYTMKVQSYYHVKTTPFIAMYNSGGKWAKYFDKVPKTDEILDAAKKLN